MKTADKQADMLDTAPGISVGVKARCGRTNGTTTVWYAAHCITRRSDGSICIFARNAGRTCRVIPAKMFAGVAPQTYCCVSGEPHPCILTCDVAVAQ